MKIYSPEDNYKLKKIQLAAKIYKKDINIEKVQFEPKVTKTFKETYPQYTLPLLETQENKFLSGTNSILLYIAGSANLTDKIQKAKIIEQLQKIQKQLDSATGVLILKSKGVTDLTQSQLQKSKQIVLKYLKQQNEKLTLRTFLTSDRLTIADISSYFNIIAVKQHFEKELQKFKNLDRWIKHIESLQRF